MKFVKIVENFWGESVEKRFPKTEGEFRSACDDDMNAEWQFFYAFPAIDGSHFPIKCPPGGPEAMKQYHNFKNLSYLWSPR